MLREDELTDGERTLWRAVETGALVDLGTGDPEADDPAVGDSWGPERTVRAALLSMLLAPGATAPRPRRAVVLRGARISGALDLEAATLDCPLTLQRCFFDAPVNLKECHAKAIRLPGCHLPALAAEALRTDGNLELNGITTAVVDLLRARIGGRLGLEGAALSGGSVPIDLADATLAPPHWMLSAAGESNVALRADGLTVDHDVHCHGGFEAHGHVRLMAAHVGGQLSFNGATLTNPHGMTLSADRLRVEQSMFCAEGFSAEGQVNLVDAHVGGQLAFKRATLSNEGGWALAADGLTVDGDMYCDEGFTAHGEIYLAGAHVGGQLHFDGAALLNEGRRALSLYEATVATSLWLRPAALEGRVDLRSARLAVIHDSEATWPSSLRLQGCAYDQLLAHPEVTAKARVRWLQRDPDGYAPQPYEQLVGAYRRAGRDEDARLVAIAKQRARRKTLSPIGRLWGLFLAATVGYGYRTWQAALWLLGLMVLGTAVFSAAYPRHMTAAHAGPGVPDFHAAIFAFDTVIPVINLHQRDAWIPSGAAQWIAALLTIAGWVLTTAAVGALSGLLRKD